MLTNESSPAKRDQLARSWMSDLPTGNWPPYEDGALHFFLWDEDTKNTSLPGLALSESNWTPEALPFVRLAQTPLLYRRYEVNPLTDFVYWIVDGKVWRRDPFNPLTAPDALMHLASRVDLAGRGRGPWASRPPFMPRGRLDKITLGGSWFVRRQIWLYHSPSTASNKLGWQIGEMHRPAPVDAILVIDLPSDADDSILLANCLDRAFFGSGARVAIVCLETGASDVPVGGWGFAEIATREVPRLVAASGGTNAGCRIGVAATGRNAAHFLHAIVRTGPIVQRLIAVSPQVDRHSPAIEYVLRQGLPAMQGLSIQFAGQTETNEFWLRLKDGLAGKGVRLLPEEAGMYDLSSEQVDVRRGSLLPIIRTWLRD